MGTRELIEKANDKFFNVTSAHEDFFDIETTYSKQLSGTRKTETIRKQLRDRRTTLIIELSQVEELMDIEIRLDTRHEGVSGRRRHELRRRVSKGIEPPAPACGSAAVRASQNESFSHRHDGHCLTFCQANIPQPTRCEQPWQKVFNAGRMPSGQL